jgi:hypothetical protein
LILAVRLGLNLFLGIDKWKIICSVHKSIKPQKIMNVWNIVNMNGAVYMEFCCLMVPIYRHTVAGTQTWVESRGEEYLGRKLDKF